MKTYQLMPVDRRKNPEKEAEGLSIRFTSTNQGWDTLHDYVDWCVRNNKPFLLHPMAGKHSCPDVGKWIDVEAREHQESTAVPLPWNRRHQQWLAQWLQEIVCKVEQLTPNVRHLFAGWHVPGFRDSSELHIPVEFKGFNNWDKKLTTAIMDRVEMMQRVSDVRCIVDYSHIWEIAPDLLPRLEDYAVALQHNALKETSNIAWIVHEKVSRWPYARGYQTVGEENRAGNPEEIFQIAKETGAEWLEIYPSQVRAWDNYQRKANNE